MNYELVVFNVQRATSCNTLCNVLQGEVQRTATSVFIRRCMLHRKKTLQM